MGMRWTSRDGEDRSGRGFGTRVVLTGLLLLGTHHGASHAQSARAADKSLLYSVPVALPAPKRSPAEDPKAPYTPLVLNLIHQLEPDSPPTLQQLENAARLLTTQGGTYEHPGGSNPTCHNLANVALNATTTPSIMPLCFSDGLGVNVVSGPNVGRTTGLPSMLMLASSFDRGLANAMGQLEGREGRNLMVTGLLGPQADTDVFVNWGRGHHTSGEDPYLNGEISAAQINGIQGQGLMAQVKHFAAYYGADGDFTDVPDQALHEMLLPPYEIALKEGGASSIMCSYQKFRDPSRYLAKDVDLLSSPSPFAGASMRTWPMNEAHYACENPLLLTYVLRTLWGSKVFVASDYGAVHSAHAFLQGDDHEDPTDTYLDGTDPGSAPGKPDRGVDATSSTCADAQGKPVSCAAAGAVHVAGIPGPGCPATGCGLAHAVANGTVPLPVFNQALARVLYQEERFGLIGCDNTRADCANPGGLGADRSGLAPLPEGEQTGPPVLGTKDGDAAIAELVAEEGAVLLKNEAQSLPITPATLRGGIAVSGAGAEYLVANPNNEGAVGFADRNAINPLQQLRALSGAEHAFSYVPANAPTGQAVPCTVLSSQPGRAAVPAADRPGVCAPGAGLQRASGQSVASLTSDRVDTHVDYTSVSAMGRLQGGKMYRWSGSIYVPAADAYVFRIQHSSEIPEAHVTFTLDGSDRTLVDAVSFYHGQYYGNMPVPVTATNAGYTEAGLRNRQCALRSAKQPEPAGPTTGCDDVPVVGWHTVTLTMDATGLPASAELSFRFAVSRRDGDIRDAAEAARGKAMALVFAHDEGRNTAPQQPSLSALSSEQAKLIDAIAEQNPNTVVVLNTGTPFVLRGWINNPHVRAVLTMWHAGQEGGTATARLLLGQANPSGHTTVTWPRNENDTVEGYVQERPLYPGDTPGAHPERLNGGKGSAQETQGIYSGYRFYDQANLPVQFPFGFGLSYTTFQFSGLKVRQEKGGPVAVSFAVKNVGAVAGAAVPQVYVGPGPARAGVQQAVRSLRGFARVFLDPGQTKEVTISLDERSFQYWDEPRQQWTTNEGTRTLYVGEADADRYLPLSTSLPIVRAAQ